jgi:hypothetical protein
MNRTTMSLAALAAAALLMTGCSSPSFSVPTAAGRATIAPRTVTAAPSTVTVRETPAAAPAAGYGQPCPELVGIALKAMDTTDQMVTIGHDASAQYAATGDASGYKSNVAKVSELAAEGKALSVEGQRVANSGSCLNRTVLQDITKTVELGTAAVTSMTAEITAIADGGDAAGAKLTADADYESFESSYVEFKAQYAA